MNEIGSILKTTRENSGVTIEEASADLNIKDVILENIEEGKIGIFKDVFELKKYIREYAKYLGLDGDKLIDEFNEYLFEYTSKIPVKEIEKAVAVKEKQKNDIEIASPYTKEIKKHSKYFYISIYILIVILVIVAIIWSVKQITVDKTVANVISYVK